MALPFIKLSGTPYEQGFKHGAHLKGRVEHNLELYFRRFKNELKLSSDEVLGRAELYAEAIAKQNPAYELAMQGLAAGAGVLFEAIVALNVRYEIMYYELWVGDEVRKAQAGADGCTSFAILPERMNNHHLVLGQTWDWIPEVQGAIVQTLAEDNLQTLAFTEAGIVGGKIGFNSAGLGLCINGLSSLQDDWKTLYKPFHVRCYEVLRSQAFEQAKAVIAAEHRPGSANFLLAQIPDKVVNIETAPQTFCEVRCRASVLSHANHFVDPEQLELSLRENEQTEGTRRREVRMWDLLGSKEQLGFDDVRAFLSDHDGQPDAVCRHDDLAKPIDERYATITAILIDLNSKTLWATDGPGCENDFVEYRLD